MKIWTSYEKSVGGVWCSAHFSLRKGRLLYRYYETYIVNNVIFVCFDVVMTVNRKIGVFWHVTPCTYRQMAPLKCPTCIPNYTALEYIQFIVIHFVEYPHLFKRSSAMGEFCGPFFMYAHYKI